MQNRAEAELGSERARLNRKSCGGHSRGRVRGQIFRSLGAFLGEKHKRDKHRKGRKSARETPKKRESNSQRELGITLRAREAGHLEQQ